MTSDEQKTIGLARRTMLQEAESLTAASDRLGSEMHQVVEMLYSTRGKAVVTGLGKSGMIARKIAGTLSGTGCPATFLHPVDALHGEFGVVLPDDVVVALSNSGETEEILLFCGVARAIGCKIVAITGNGRSSLNQMSDVALDGSVSREACPLNLAPTSSAMVAMALGDALSACLIQRTGFTPKAFGKLHPAGSLGKRLLLRVRDIMHQGAALPLSDPTDSLKDVLVTLSEKAMGAVIVVDSAQKLVGIFTDGDLRRAIEQHRGFLDLSLQDVMTTSPVSILDDHLAIRSLELMESRPSQISVLPVVDKTGKAVGIVRIHDLLRAGIKSK